MAEALISVSILSGNKARPTRKEQVRARFDSKTFVGLHFIAPYYYMVGVESDDTHSLAICFHQKLHHHQ
ncbi:MAG: hypothetical protein ACOYOK_15590, partial [Pseudobdellovibrionaceae bacterium]